MLVSVGPLLKEGVDIEASKIEIYNPIWSSDVMLCELKLFSFQP